MSLIINPYRHHPGPWTVTFTGTNGDHPDTAPIAGYGAEYSIMGAHDNIDPTGYGAAYHIYSNLLAIKTQSPNWQAVHWELPIILDRFEIEIKVMPLITSDWGVTGVTVGATSHNPYSGDVWTFRNQNVRNYRPTTVDYPYSFNTSTWYTLKVSYTPTERKMYVNDVLQTTRTDGWLPSTPKFGYQSWYTQAKSNNAPLCEYIKVTRI